MHISSNTTPAAIATARVRAQLKVAASSSPALRLASYMLMVDRREAHDYFFEVNDGGFEQHHLIYCQATDAGEPVGGKGQAPNPKQIVYSC